MAMLRQVNTADLLDAIRLGCGTMQRVFNADDNHIPFFSSRVWPEAFLRFSSAHSEAHVPGRHLNALLEAEDAAGIEVEETALDRHTAAAFLSYSGPVALPLNRQEPGGPLLNFLPHNVREGFHALYALARYRHSARAQELAAASIAAIFEQWDPGKGWDVARLEKLGLKVHDSPGVAGVQRAIGPLVKYYRAIGYGPALELALFLKDAVLARCYPEDGAYVPHIYGAPSHSTTCVLSSLAQLAELTRDAPLMNRVQAFYDRGLWAIRDAVGWSIEGDRPQGNPDRGEANNTGDILETALILGRWGFPQYYGDAERILRSHLLPSQLRDISFIEEPPNPADEDGKRDVARRHLGAFGFPAPYGHQPVGIQSISFNMDIVGGATASLGAAYGQAACTDQAGHRVNLLFDLQTPALQVESPYTHPTLRVRLKQPGPLFVRLPSWVDPGEVQVQGTGEQPRLVNGYLFLARPPRHRWLSFEFPLLAQEITLAHRTRQIRARLRGDEVVAMDNFGADFTFFPALE